MLGSPALFAYYYTVGGTLLRAFNVSYGRERVVPSKGYFRFLPLWTP